MTTLQIDGTFHLYPCDQHALFILNRDVSLVVSLKEENKIDKLYILGLIMNVIGTSKMRFIRPNYYEDDDPLGRSSD